MLKSLKERIRSLATNWYVWGPLLALLLLVDAIVQNHLYFVHYYDHVGWSNTNSDLSMMAFVVLLVIMACLVGTCLRYLLRRRRAERGMFAHKVTDVAALGAAIVVVVSAFLLAIEQVAIGDCYGPQQARHEIGQHACVMFHVSRVYTSWDNNTFLDEKSGDYSQGFSVYVPDGSGLHSSTAHQYLNKTITVTGTITEYMGSPQIMVSDPSQIR